LLSEKVSVAIHVILPLLVNSATEAYKSSAEPHFLYFRHLLNLHQLYLHILKPNYMPNTALFMQLSEGKGGRVGNDPGLGEIESETAQHGHTYPRLPPDSVILVDEKVRRRQRLKTRNLKSRFQ
jgi:hypothetical protein